jgi:hypothetical protein
LATSAVVEGLFNVLSTVVLVAAGSWLAIVQLRKTRGFDRRLEWCDSMMRAINAAGAAVTSATMAPSHEGREECWSQVIRLYENLIPLCGVKEMYASATAIEQITAFMTELEKLIEAHLSSHDSDSLDNDCDSGVCLNQLRLAAGSLALIARHHLRLEDLPGSMKDSSQRFLGSFRGHRLGDHEAAFE